MTLPTGLRQHHASGNDLFAPRDNLPMGRFERVLRSGKFAVTAELDPPDSANPQDVYDRALVLAEVCDAINATDAAGSHVHMSSIAVCSLLSQAGYSVIMQMACRDRNRIAMQGDILGASALGVANLLCISGDSVGVGDQPEAKPVCDLDAISLLQTVKTMRDDAKFLSGRPLSTPPPLFIGAVANPFAPPYEFRPLRLAKKIAAGAQFIQTQYCFDLPMLKDYMQRVRDLGLHERCFILVGVGPLVSAKAARRIRDLVPGVHIPDAMIKRLEGAENPREEGKQICIEMIQALQEIDGVAGVHVMAYRQEKTVKEIVLRSGVLQGRRAESRSRERTNRED